MNITASERSSLIRLASSLPKGSEERRAILAAMRHGPVIDDLKEGQFFVTTQDGVRFPEGGSNYLDKGTVIQYGGSSGRGYTGLTPWFKAPGPKIRGEVGWPGRAMRPGARGGLLYGIDSHYFKPISKGQATKLLKKSKKIKLSDLLKRYKRKIKFMSMYSEWLLSWEDASVSLDVDPPTYVSLYTNGKWNYISPQGKVLRGKQPDDSFLWRDIDKAKKAGLKFLWDEVLSKDPDSGVEL